MPGSVHAFCTLVSLLLRVCLGLHPLNFVSTTLAPALLPVDVGIPCPQDLPCLDSPAPQPGFKLNQVAAALGSSIQQLRQQELQQLQLQRGKQEPATQTTPAPVTKQGSKARAVQLPTLQQPKQQGQAPKQRPGQSTGAVSGAAEAAESAAQAGKTATRGVKAGGTSKGSCCCCW